MTALGSVVMMVKDWRGVPVVLSFHVSHSPAKAMGWVSLRPMAQACFSFPLGSSFCHS